VILITGATGFIGRAIVARLLADGRRVAVLARRRDGLGARDRVTAALGDAADAGRVEVIEAELTAPDAGIAPGDLGRLRGCVETVVHCAGDTSFAPRALAPFVAGHVDGPVALLRALAPGGLARWAHVSTAFVCGDRGGTARESGGDVGQGFHNVYERVKLEAETAVRAAGHRVAVLVVGSMALLAGAPLVDARSPLVGQLNAAATRYHEDPARLDTLREGLEHAVGDDPDAANFTALSRVCFIWGDVRARSDEDKLAAYERGREAGRRAVELEPKAFLGHLWYAINTARWGQTKGVVRSLFLLPAVREEIRVLLELAPDAPAVYALAGNVDLEVPGPLGGDIDRAEAEFRKGLQLDPNFTGIRVGLAKVLVKKGRLPEARRELQTVLDEKDPSNAADWTVKDVPDARRLLESLRER
jgi:NAD(P)-dependent dehydrogenase (short-subunit alcohol dehydrogenase family)